MTERHRHIYDKSSPGANGRKFIPFPSDAKHYVHHPKVNPGMLLLYAILIDRYNVDVGYAYPGLDSLAVEYGTSYNTTSKHVEILKEVGLIDYPEKGRYVPLEPLPESEFYEEFPEAWKAYVKSYNASQSKRETDRERLRKWREQRGYVE